MGNNAMRMVKGAAHRVAGTPLPRWSDGAILQAAFNSDIEAANSLTLQVAKHKRAQLVAIMYRARVAPETFRRVLEDALTMTEDWDGTVMQAARTRDQLIRWCRYAQFQIPTNFPEWGIVYQGTSSSRECMTLPCFSWSLDFDCAA